MKKRTLLISFIAAFSYLAVSSYSGGPASNGLGDFTGSPLSVGTCSATDCHQGGAGATIGKIELRKKTWGASSTPVTYYEAGESYLVTVSATNPSSLLTHFGFQFTALKNSNNSPVGTYSNLGTDVQVFPGASPTIVEHSAPLLKDVSGEFIVNFEWTAPATSEGRIDLYAIVNAVDNNDTSTGDDPSGTISVQLNDLTSVGTVSREVIFKTYPNPFSTSLTLDMDKAEEGMYDIHVYSYNGTLVSKTELYISPLSYTATFNTSDWKPGMYFMQISKDDNSRVMNLVKM